MRWKIIVANAIIVVLVGLVMGALLWSQLRQDLASRSQMVQSASQAVAAANAQMKLDALQIEHWLNDQVAQSSAREPFEASVATARGEVATKQANRLYDAAVQTSSLSHVRPAIIAFVDVRGIALGRNGNNLMRGDDIGHAHPEMQRAVAQGKSGSEIWYVPNLAQQWFVSFVPVRSAAGEVLGSIIYGTPMNDERLTQIAEKTSGSAIAIMVQGPRGIDIPAKSRFVSASDINILSDKSLAEKIIGSVTPDPVEQPFSQAKKWVVVSALVSGYGGPTAALVRVAPAVSVNLLSTLVYPIATAVILGIVMVMISGWIFSSYITKPIEKIENDLLQIVNGNTELRLDIEHAVLGGVVFSINALLNQFTGVKETPQEEAQPLSVALFSQALQDHTETVSVAQVEQDGTENVSAQVVRELAAEPADAYYQRLFSEYIEAKRQCGDVVEHITEQGFLDRIRNNEQQAARQHGRPVRFQVLVRDGQVVLVAVQLPE